MQTAERAPLLPAPDLSVDIPSNGAYFPEQDVASLTPADIEDAISVKVETPQAQAPVAVSETQVASLQAVSGPFDAAEYERLKNLAQAKHAKEVHAKEIMTQQEAVVEPVSLMTPELQSEAQIADIATAAGEDLETAGMMMPDPGLSATDAPMDISFSSGGALSVAEYAALKARLNKPAKQAAVLKQTSLSDAINQLVPPEFQITVGNGVDMTQTVSWHDGANWQDIIAETLGQVGAEARVNGSVVMLMSMAQ